MFRNLVHLHKTTALVLLKHLAKHDLIRVSLSTFMVPKYPERVHLSDVREAFVTLAEAAGHDPRRDVKFAQNFGLEAWTKDKLFEKLFKIIFVNEKLFPKQAEGSMMPGKAAGELPNLFVGSEKTQVRQIPLSDSPPWPFKFLLELGGMVVIKTDDNRKMLLELKQFLNNHPQFEIRVDAKECPDGSVAIFTWWFQRVSRLQKRKNLNVPGKE